MIYFVFDFFFLIFPLYFLRMEICFNGSECNANKDGVHNFDAWHTLKDSSCWCLLLLLLISCASRIRRKIESRHTHFGWWWPVQSKHDHLACNNNVYIERLLFKMPHDLCCFQFLASVEKSKMNEKNRMKPKATKPQALFPFDVAEFFSFSVRILILATRQLSCFRQTIAQ